MQACRVFAVKLMMRRLMVLPLPRTLTPTPNPNPYPEPEPLPLTPTPTRTPTQVLMANAEKRHVKCIQHHYREHLKRTSNGADTVDAALANPYPYPDP